MSEGAFMGEFYAGRAKAVSFPSLTRRGAGEAGGVVLFPSFPRKRESSLRCAQERSADRLWQLYFHKPVGRVQVIFAAFIYAPNISVFGCVFVRQYAIDFVQFHGRELRQPELIDWRERHSFHRDYVRALQQLLRETGGQARESESIDSTSAIRMCVQELVDLLSDSWECARESANNVILHAASHFREILSGET
jgi:hypothetical protein